MEVEVQRIKAFLNPEKLSQQDTCSIIQTQKESA